jgi:hypothetical protein
MAKGFQLYPQDTCKLKKNDTTTKKFLLHKDKEENGKSRP